ncbi:MAG: cytochrome C [Deltaproteobacteria bacterium]|nr:cytochrome C [Deltaproteobacteria bacterium]
MIRKKTVIVASAPLLVCLLLLPLRSVAGDAEKNGCTAAGCHQGIEPIRQPDTEMMKRIKALADETGIDGYCAVCHGGNPDATDKDLAHTGAPEALTGKGGPDSFFPDPGSPWINEKTCGLCHQEQVSAQRNSLMMTEAGKLQGTAWAFGSLTGYRHTWGNYEAHNPKDAGSRFGTDAYRAYMQRLKEKEPNVFPDALVPVPEAPRDLGKLAEHPERSALTYVRTECERCHLGVKGRQKRGDYRGMGCSACHIPYGNEGLYEGADQTIDQDEPGHLLVHSIQASRRTEVNVNGRSYTGIPVETCTTCHDRGKRIGVSFQGLMESAYESPFTQGGKGQVALHTKHYIAMSPDVHSSKGMLCHDCHTSSDIHGDRFLSGTTLAPVEIECTDCHGTPWAYPWELPLGFGEEFGDVLEGRPERGTSEEPPAYTRNGEVYPKMDGYLVTARGNPFGKVVRDGNEVIVYTSGGKDLRLAPLRLLKDEGRLTQEGLVAMDGVRAHIGRMECYTCHAQWAPQCYGCHVKVDYSKGRKSFDWVAAGRRHQDPGHAADPDEDGYGTTIPGHVDEQRSYMRWEDPPMVVNGEGRISPAIPGCQVSVTVIGPNGGTILKNHIFRTLPGSEGSGPKGQLGLDMSPVNPHTSGKSRSCASCHASAKALGYGIGGGLLNRPWDKPTVVDLAAADGSIIPASAVNQIEPIEGLEADWSRLVTENGRQFQTVGHHFSGSRPLNNEERDNIDRGGVCLACHQEIPRASLAVNLLHHVAAHVDALPRSDAAHADLLHKVLLTSAWAQVGGGFLGAVFLVMVWYLRRRRKRARQS